MQGGAGTGDQRPDALGTAQLMGRQGQGVGAEGREIDGDLAGCLHGVDMQPAVGGANKGRSLGDRLNDAGLIIGQHQAHQGPAGGLEVSFQPRQVRDAVGVHRPGLDWQAAGLCCFEHGVMLGGPHDDTGKASRPGAFDGQGIGFGAAADERHGAGRHAGERSDTAARCLDQIAGSAAGSMDRRRIGRCVEGAQQGVTRLGTDRGGGVVVQIHGSVGQGHSAAISRACAPEVCGRRRPSSTSAIDTEAR